LWTPVTDKSNARPDESDKRIDARKQELSNVITEVLRRHPLLCYFQGYHDIVQVLLLVLGAEAAPAAAARLSLLRIRDFMLPTMTGALSHLQLLPSILKAADAELFEHLSQTAPFYFALPATLTLYAHDIQEYGDIARLFDYLLTNEAVVSIYLYVTVRPSPPSTLPQHLTHFPTLPDHRLPQIRAPLPRSRRTRHAPFHPLQAPQTPRPRRSNNRHRLSPRIPPSQSPQRPSLVSNILQQRAKNYSQRHCSRKTNSARRREVLRAPCCGDCDGGGEAEAT
jgi:hypothetical protein